MAVTQSGVEDPEPCPESPSEEPRWEPQGSQARTRLCCTEQRSLLGAKVSADGPLFAENPPEVLVTQSCPTLCDPMDCQTPLLMGFSRQEDWSGLPFPPSRGSSRRRGQTCISCFAGRFFTSESPGKSGTQMDPQVAKPLQRCAKTNHFTSSFCWVS